MEEIMNKIQDKCNDIEFGSVTVTFTMHDGKIVKVEYETSEKEVFKI